MKDKIALFKESLKDDVVVNKKEYLLTLAVLILGSILLGIILSPKKEMVFGSFNGNGNYPCDQEDEDEE